MKKIALLFPGQGSQKAGMDSVIPDGVLKQASEILGYDLLEVIEDSNRLNQTKYTQTAVFTASYAIYNQFGLPEEDISFLIGHSLGEWTAAVIAGCISFEDGLKAVNERARSMDAFSEDGVMAAVLGVGSEEIEQELKGIKGVTIANYNLPSQTVITGDPDSIKEFSGSTKAKVIPLKVSGAFHSPFMNKAKTEFEKSISETEFNDAKIPLILNSTAQPETNGKTIKKSLIEQLTNPVYFYQSVDYALEQGVNYFYEIGPSKVLTNMVKKINNSVKVFAAEEIDLKPQSVNNSTNTVTK